MGGAGEGAHEASPRGRRAPPHLGAERRLLVEVAVHELAVLPSGDLAAEGRGMCQGPEQAPWP